MTSGEDNASLRDNRSWLEREKEKGGGGSYKCCIISCNDTFIVRSAFHSYRVWATRLARRTVEERRSRVSSREHRDVPNEINSGCFFESTIDTEVICGALDWTIFIFSTGRSLFPAFIFLFLALARYIRSLVVSPSHRERRVTSPIRSDWTTSTSDS